MTLAFVTCREFPNLFAEEQHLLTRLRARGIEAQAAVWDDPSVEWERFSSVVIRSTWDYFSRFEPFLAWFDRLERAGVRLFNPSALVRWNFDKRYLRDLEQRGIPIVPTVFIEPGPPVSLADLLRERGWTRAVFKPAISAGAYRTRSLSAEEAPLHQEEFEALRASMTVLVQPFAPEIVEEGEWSLLFFESKFSHAVRKLPAAGDFRVQTQYGGTAVGVDPPSELRTQAQRVIEALPARPLYARVDGIRRGGAFLLMEVEVIEPYLYFEAAPEQIDVFVDALARIASA